MKYQSLLAGAWALVAVSLFAREVSAQASPQYRTLVEQGLSEYGAKNFAEARSLFSRAVEIYPSARALRGLGMAEFELRNYGDSAMDLRRSLDSDTERLDPALRQQTEQLLARANGFVARLQLAVEPAAATVMVDGIPVQLGQQGRLVLEVGDHVIEFLAAGHAPEKRVLKVKGGEEQELRIALPRAPSRELGSAQEADPGAYSRRHRRWYLVPRATLQFPVAMRHRTTISCTGDLRDKCSTTNSGSPKADSNAGVFIGSDALFSPVANFRVGLGVHVQLNQIKHDTKDGTKDEYGRALWLPLVAEYHVPVTARVSLPLRGMFGLGLMTGGQAIKDLEANHRSACEQFAARGVTETCKLKGAPALGFVMGVGPGVIVALSDAVMLRSDLTFGYQSFRAAGLESRSARVEARVSGLLAAWSLGVDL